MASVKQKNNPSTELLLKTAEDFHGHLGPFLVVGVRMGQVGLNELNMDKKENSLHIFLKVLPNVPYSCIIDGLQVITKCTVGNQKLQVEQANDIEAKFKDLGNGRSVTVAPKPRLLTMLREQMVGKGLSEKDVCKLAWDVASIPEKDLFIVKR